MASWNKVSLGFNADDETVNFGARTVVENGGSIFETTTLAIVQSEGEVHEDPSVSASVQYSKLCVAIDKSVTIFADETCQEIVLSVGFDALTKTYRMSKDGNFVFIALDSGVLHCLHIPSGGKQVFYENVNEEFGDTIVEIFLQEEEYYVNVVIVAVSGVTYGIEKLNTTLLHSALMQDNDEELDSIVENIKLIKIFEGTKTVAAASINLERPLDELSIITIGNSIHLWPSNRSCSHSNSFHFSYKKVQFVDKYGAIVCLRDDGFLSVLCPETLLSVKIWHTPIVDFVTTQDDTDNHYQLIVLTAAEKSAATTTLMLLSFPDFERKLEISVPRTTYLVDLVGSSLENIVFLEGIVNDETRQVDTIRVKAIVENKPEYRLERFLRRGQFKEAESFADKFGLNLDPVHAAKAAAFVTQLGPWSNSETNNAEIFQLFIDTLDKINDVKYVYDCCNNALTSNYKQTRQLLLYARQRITETNIQESKDHDFVSLLKTLNSNLKKLETFEFIRTIKNEAEQEDCRNIQEWIKFSKVDLLQECLAFLSLGELEVAAAIWTRHLPELTLVMNSSIVKKILDSISDSTHPSNLRPWLSHFVPSVISLLPSALPEIIQWGYEKTRSLEKYNRKEWPQVGLDFAHHLVDLFTVRESHISFNCNQQYMSRGSDLHRLMALVRAITELLELKTQHRIVLPLQIYLGDPMIVVHQLLDKALVEAIPRLIETFLEQYIRTNSLKNDQVFCSYVQSTLKNSKSWWFWEKAPWEERIATVIKHIQDVQNRLQQTVDVLGKSPVPWSPTIIALAEAASDFDHPLASKIRAERNRVTIKLILKKYGYAQIGLCTKLFRYIIKQDRKDMIDDICELTKSDNHMKTEAFTFCINHLLKLGHIDRALEVLRNLDDQTRQQCCQQVICVIKTQLHSKERDAWLTNYMEALGPIGNQLCEVLSQQNNVPIDSNDFLRDIPVLKRINKLREKFNVWVTFDDFYASKNLALKNYINQVVSDLKNEEKSVLRCCQNLEKVSSLLGLPSLQSLLMFFNETKNKAILKHSITRMYESGIMSEDDSFYLKELCMAWMTNADRDPITSRLLLNVCASNLVSGYGQSANYMEAISCHNQVAAYVEVIGQEEVPYQSALGTKDSVWNFDEQSYSLYSIYEDAAISSGNELSLGLFKDSSKIIQFYEECSSDDQPEKNDSSTELEIQLLVKAHMEKAKHIQNEHHSYAALRISKNLHYSLSAFSSVDATVLTETRAALSSCLYTLLRKIVSARSLDVCLGLSCLLMLTESEAIEWFKVAGRSLQSDLLRHREVVNLGCEYYRIIKRETLFHELYNLDRQKLLHRWSRKLTEYGISYQEMFASDMEQKRSILERIMHLKSSPLISLLEDFCDDFGFNKDECFLLYLEVLLSSWQPRMNFTTVNGRKELKIDENDVRNLNVKCGEVAAKIQDKALLKSHLTKLSPQVNFYHYEVFLTMIDLCGERNVERIELFCFLKNYTRYGSPTEFEREAWALLCHDNSSLPPISQWRLPFLPKCDQYKLIIPELNLKTYEQWLSIAPTLKIQSHVICTMSIKGSVTEAWKSYVNDASRSQVWSLYPLNSGLLKDIKKCIKRMEGLDGLYYGTAALYFVVNHTPQGADQVAAAQACFASAQLWEERSEFLDESDERMIAKVKDKYLRLTSKHILHIHGVGDDKYTKLIGQPEKLIRELYNDESIPERFKGAIQHRPDINAAADALGRLFSFNMTTMRYNFLLEWLRFNVWKDKHNESMTMGFGNSIPVVEDDRTEENNLLRACYILESEDSKLHVGFLINVAFATENGDDGYGAGFRFRALRVLQSIVDENELQDLTKHDPKSLREYMKSLRYLDELERLGLAYTLTSFENYCKRTLAQILLKNLNYVPRALSLIIQICIDYNVHDHLLLDATLERMVKLSMVEELEKFLPIIGTMTMISGSGYTAGWQLIVATPFMRLGPRPTPEQFSDCVRLLRLLHACPVISKLDFKEIISQCFHCSGAVHFAAALLPFLPENDQHYVMERFKTVPNLTNVIDRLIELSSLGILVTSQTFVTLKAISADGLE
ncbi:kinetochore-associated protein 1 isoform X2 [Venturia canescens]|uniref:kinetochore-associated protein 1 isoform X2 n=1 Tax=Venturia canescens TaxID=32260 RepID=UPI001C9C7D77|nr:kinetochore-associated protein 1 isoform X2 [Venturia canescens]